MKFPPRQEKRGALYVPETSQLRPEFGEILDIGEAVGDEERACAALLHDLKRAGKKIPVSVEAGTRYWRDTYEVEQWLADVRVYHVAQLASYLKEHPDYGSAK